MDKKIKIDLELMRECREGNWNLYASQRYNDKLLRLWTNSVGYYKVEYGGEVIYEGSQLTHMLEAWKSV
ncbi:MAG: hypothetical protein KAR40_14040 [Candidatus Sabulitectum sp.]|nr:hypothetical protein [Candidatus Sabulitectum sp.]